MIRKVTRISKNGRALNLNGGTEYNMDPIIPIKKTRILRNSFGSELKLRVIIRFKGISRVQIRNIHIKI
jgi:hypothetical protein